MRWRILASADAPVGSGEGAFVAILPALLPVCLPGSLALGPSEAGVFQPRASTMRALLVLQDTHQAARLESILAARGWTVSHMRDPASEVIPILTDDPLDLVVIEEDGTGDGARLIGRLREEWDDEPPWMLVWLSHADVPTLHAVAETSPDDILFGDPSELQWERHLDWAQVRGAFIPAVPAGGFAARLPHASGEFERRFHVQRAFLQGLFENAPEGVVIVDARDRIVRINSEFTRLFGYTAEEARGRFLNDLIVPDHLRAEGAQLDEQVRAGERVIMETVRRHKEGHLIDVSLLATYIDVNGPAGAFGIYRDITDKKRHDSLLRLSEERYRALFDQSPVGVLLCDRHLRITHCNAALTRIVEAPSSELIGAHLVTLRDRRLIPGLRAALRGKPAFYEGPFRSRAGRQRTVSIQYAPLRDDQGEVVGGMGVFEDISARVTAEKELRAQATEMERVNAALRERTLELEAAMQARSRLYTSMNHELRTPISAVLLYQELLIAGSLGPLAEEQLRALEHSHTATRHLLDLVRDILDLSKIEAGKVTVQPVQIRLDTLLNEVQAAVTPLTERYGSELSLSMESDLGEVVTDPQRVRQILLNFVSNAAKYGRRNPIRIVARREETGESVIEVRDRGIGISRDHLEHIFEDFVQLGAEREEGTGLGLAISRRLADLLGGHLAVDSELGVGSTFRLILPGPRESVGAAGVADSLTP